MLRVTTRMAATGAGVALVLSATVASAAGAATEEPRAGNWVVSVGDSYISGEGGRWAGNTNGGSDAIDALGPTAYWDTPTGEAIPRCHRSTSAEIHFGSGTTATNLACSGARTATFTDSSGRFKPGLDFYSDSSGHVGQARALREFARSHTVKMVALSIGGNDFNFGSVVQSCVVDFLTSPSFFPNYCNDDDSVLANFTAANVETVTAHITTGINNIHKAMADAGYKNADYTIVVQNYPAPIPAAAGFRYGESGFTRQTTGGCGFWNADADWATNTIMPLINRSVRAAVTRTGLTNVRNLNLSGALNGRRLCENTVGLLEEKGLTSWQNTGAVNRTEWVDQIRTTSTVFGPYFVQESLHPNYWGQLALRNCLRKAWNGGTVRGGACTIGSTGLNANGEPIMTLS